MAMDSQFNYELARACAETLASLDTGATAETALESLSNTIGSLTTQPRPLDMGLPLMVPDVWDGSDGWLDPHEWDGVSDATFRNVPFEHRAVDLSSNREVVFTLPENSEMLAYAMGSDSGIAASPESLEPASSISACWYCHTQIRSYYPTIFVCNTCDVTWHVLDYETPENHLPDSGVYSYAADGYTEDGPYYDSRSATFSGIVIDYMDFSKPGTPSCP
jgi:hypothetical protein